MPAELELLNSTDAADSMKNDGTEFCIEAGTGSPARWRVIPQRNLLQLCVNENVHLSRQLEPRLMQLLCLLAQADGKVLTRDTLMDTLWPRVIVNENSLTRAVSELRKAFLLPDNVNPTGASSGSRLIETVPKRGYRLNACLVPDNNNARELATPARPSYSRQTIAHHTAMRYPAIAAAMIISAALSSVWTLKLSDSQNGLQTALPTQFATQSPVPDARQTSPGDLAVKPQLEDRVLTDSVNLPEGLHWLESVHNESDNLNGLQAAHISETVLAPGGQMMAFIEDYPDQSQLRLRSLVNPDEAWTVFTSSSPITHLQWSPLDAGLLFTVQDKDGVANMAMHDGLATGSQLTARLSRLMLLDLETLQIRELYRRIVPYGDDQIGTVGSLT